MRQLYGSISVNEWVLKFIPCAVKDKSCKSLTFKGTANSKLHENWLNFRAIVPLGTITENHLILCAGSWRIGSEPDVGITFLTLHNNLWSSIIHLRSGCEEIFDLHKKLNRWDIVEMNHVCIRTASLLLPKKWTRKNMNLFPCFSGMQVQRQP